MASVCFYFQVHQPLRIKKFSVFDIGRDKSYFNDKSGTKLDNEWVINKISSKCYLPTNKILLNLLRRYPEFRLSFSFSGVFLEQVEAFAPEVLDSFKKLVSTGRVEILAETYYHSLAFFYSKREFGKQITKHEKKIKELFGVTPTILRNTELAYTNDFGVWAQKKGYKAVLAEGWDAVLGWRSPNFVYKPSSAQNIKLLLKNYRLSDDIAFRFSEKSWKGWPLTADKFAHWISSVNGNGEVVNLFMDYESFGEHQWQDAGIFEFLNALPGEILKHPDNDFKTPTEVADSYSAKDEVDMPDIVTWADTERDLSAWVGNSMQQRAIDSIYSLEEKVLASENEELTESWRKLQTSDHFYYMCTKWANDGDIHAYFSPYESPYDAFISYMNVVNDLKLRL